MAKTIFTFPSGAGYQLSGHLEPPEGTPRGWAIFAHCFTCGKDSRAAVYISRALSRAGIGVLRFDFAGTGIGGGTGEPVSFASDVADIRAAATAMAAAGMSPSLLVGHSLGGTAVIVAAGELPEVAAVATIGAPADLKHILRVFRPSDLETIASDGEATVEIAGRPFLVRRSFLEAIEGIDLEKAIACLRRPLLVMHSPLDQVVSIDHATRIFVASKHPKSFISLDTADHLLTDVADANYASAMVAAWASRFLPQLTGDLPQVEVAEGVVATETLEGTFRLKIRSGEHTLFADEPASVGGLGTGLSPYELVSAGLAACTVMTMRLYANRKGFPLERASTTVQHEKVPDMMPPDRFNRIVVLEGPLNDDQRSRILAIADRCPVDLSLIRGSDVQTGLSSTGLDKSETLALEE
ncbi:MAG: bifunctional alpha/beta hydrolase/OsmC family protein [Hyphomicrobium sp.]|uniref:bifunctional alpha/beta hydrolase/OsmC family protein n=1 Tax=Hyphomicrobium sp. TaxID=82 RepID=UPI0025C171AF|nr:bifunctional alpha/beta hydrolase/OsmC family protein [Hyphomicrobium sp.]MBX9864835.1 bifunctional alpha/beta hydrolase/OsmC family protein [Hyphomicrobium sp.]